MARNSFSSHAARFSATLIAIVDTKLAVTWVIFKSPPSAKNPPLRSRGVGALNLSVISQPS